MANLDQIFIHEALLAIKVIPQRMATIKSLLAKPYFQETENVDSSDYEAGPTAKPKDVPFDLASHGHHPNPQRRSARLHLRDQIQLPKIGGSESEDHFSASEDEVGWSSGWKQGRTPKYGNNELMSLSHMYAHIASEQTTTPNETIQEIQTALHPLLVQLQTDIGIILYGLKAALAKAMDEKNHSLGKVLATLEEEVLHIRAFPTTHMESWIGHLLERHGLEQDDEILQFMDDVFILNLKEALEKIRFSYAVMLEAKNPLKGHMA